MARQRAPRRAVGRGWGARGLCACVLSRPAWSAGVCPGRARLGVCARSRAAPRSPRRACYPAVLGQAHPTHAPQQRRGALWRAISPSHHQQRRPRPPSRSSARARRALFGPRGRAARPKAAPRLPGLGRAAPEGRSSPLAAEGRSSSRYGTHSGTQRGTQRGAHARY